jgi:hypothetical protein
LPDARRAFTAPFSAVGLGGAPRNPGLPPRNLMFGLAYVLIARRFDSLQAELDRALAAFRRGGKDDLPREKLSFFDETQRLTDGRRVAGWLLP